MLLVAGATGMLGGEIARLLLDAGKPVRAMVRATSDADAVRRLEEAGAEIVVADVKDAGSLEAAVAGASTVITGVTAIFPKQAGDSLATVDRDGQLALVDAAAAAGAEHLVYISYSGGIEDNSPLTTAKRAVEQHLAAAGPAYTILRPTYFMEVWLSPAVGFDPAAGRVRIYGSGEAPVSWISLSDVAAFAVTAVDAPAARHRRIELGGPDGLSPRQVVALAEHVRGAPIALDEVPVEALERQRDDATDDTTRVLSALMLALAGGDAIDMGATLAELPIRQTTVEQYLRRTLTRDHP